MFGVLAAACVAFGSAWVNAQAPQSPPRPASPGFLAGQVVEWPSGRAISGAVVSLIGPAAGRAGGAQRPVITDAQGRFYFANVVPGAFGTTTIKDGYSYLPSAVFNRTNTLAAGERITDLKITLVKLGVISGTVRDDAGDPVAGMTVTALRRTLVNGRMTMTSPTRAKSDDRGFYRIAGLQPTDYVVCACVLNSIPLDGVLLTTLAAEPMQLLGIAGRALKVGADVVSLDDTLRTFAPTLYPNSTTIARADRVTVKPGEEKSSVDFNLTPTKAVHISGTISGSASPVSASNVQLIPTGESEEGAAMMQLNPALVQPDGRFDFINVPPGRYELRVQMVQTSARGGAPTGQAMQLLGSRMGGSGPSVQPSPTDPALFGSVSLTVGDTDMTGVSVFLKPGPVVSGKIRLVGNATPSPQSLQRLLVVVSNLTPAPGLPVQNTGFPVNPDLTFRTPWTIPGRSRLTAVGLPEFPTVKSVEVGNVDVMDTPIDINGDLSDVVITLSDVALSTITGTVQGTGTAEDLTALIFPADWRMWAEPEGAYRRYRAVAVSRAGAFTITSLISGDYLLAVVPDPESADWQQQSRLEALSKTATRVTLLDGEKKTIEVKR